MTNLQHIDNRWRSAAPPRHVTDNRRRVRVSALAAVVLLLGCWPAAAQPANRRHTVAAAGPSSLRDWDAALDRLDRAGELQRYDTRPNLYRADRQTERFAQYHEGIPVYGADLVRQTDAGLATAIFGTLFTGIDVDTTPGLTLSAARAAFDELAGELLDTPSLWVFPGAEGEYTLAYRGTLSSFRDVFIDADTGEKLFEVSRIRDQTIGLGTGVLGDLRKMGTESIGATFRTQDRFRPALIRTLDMENDEVRFLNNLIAQFNGAPVSLLDLAADSDNQWEDGTVVDVHAGLGWSYDYLATQLGWAGIDGADGAVTAFVHPVNPERVVSEAQQCLETAADPFEDCIVYLILLGAVDNAAYFYPPPGVAGSTGFLVFGEPLDFPMPLTVLEIVAHEMAHGVTNFTAALGDTPPPNEPGAINEAFSDIIGTATEFYVEEPGDGPLRADYLVGEDTGFPIRSLRDPQELQNGLTGPYPDHYDNLYRGEFDDGGVHVNSTILSHAYFLAVEGGTNRTSGLGVTGVGHENRLQIERIFFNACLGQPGAVVRRPRHRRGEPDTVGHRPVRIGRPRHPGDPGRPPRGRDSAPRQSNEHVQSKLPRFGRLPMMPRLQAGTRPFAFAALAAAVLLPATAGAQTGGYLSFNGGTQATSTTFDDNIGFTEFHEDADFNAGYGIGTGTVFDAGGGVRLASGLGFGVGVSRFEKLDPVAIDARVPHPFFFNRPRSLTGTEPDLTRLETAVHLEVRWFESMGDTVELAVFGGPTFFNLQQDLVTTIGYDHVYPYAEASFASASTSPASASAVGFNAGVDIGFFFSEVVGLGAIIRYSGASVELPGEGESLVPVDAGGFQLGGGLRLRF